VSDELTSSTGGNSTRRTLTYTATEATSTGARAINLKTGRFYIDNALTDADGAGGAAAERDAVIHGQLHGATGQAVSGIWFPIENRFRWKHANLVPGV